MAINLKGRANFTTKRNHENEGELAQTRPDVDNNIKIVLGEIKEFDPGDTGRLFATVLVPGSGGRKRLWGDGALVAILYSPLDIMQRFGQIQPGMKVEIHWKGISETGVAWAHIISEKAESKGEVNTIPLRQVDTYSSLPFEPGGGF